METQYNFPSELLDASVAERQSYFKNKVVAHRHILNAHTHLMSILRQAIEGQIVMLIGAPGVGKSTVRKAMVRDLSLAFLLEENPDPQRIPVAGIELEAFQGGIFKWKKTRQSILKALHEPLVDKKVKYNSRIYDNGNKLEIDPRLSADDLGEILVEVLAQRKPRALWFDEGQHLIKVSGAKDLLHQLDVLKSLANRSQVPLVLFGTYEMNALLGLSPQLDRRIRRIHIPRYKANNKEDTLEFQRVLLGFQKHLPFPREPQLLEHWDYFFEGSLGCIGILKDWLYQAASTAFEQSKETLSQEICENWIQDRNVLVDILRRIRTGEQVFEQSHSQMDLRTLLGFSWEESEPETPRKQAGSSASSQKPGRRKPIRDKVGIDAKRE